ncbi:MAG: carboxypeptidase regulatory-like domain-containing protein [Bdellovibrionales bacterium]|nr:carboxypeptidase regulatory-like domain-containing protein [Bdellovibrionales bacterium]
MILERAFKTLSLTLATLIAGLAFAQTSPVMVDLHELPSLNRLKQNPAWTPEDTETAVVLVQKYLSDTKKDFPIDCRFEIAGPISSNYEPLEERTTVENRLRRMKIPLVMFTQEGVWKDYPSARTKFKPLKPDSPLWQKFLSDELPRIDHYLRTEYAVGHPYGPRGFRGLKISGYDEACPDIQRYLTLVYKAYPSGVECDTSATSARNDDQDQDNNTWTRTDNFYISSYKLGFPYADSYSYRVLTVKNCTFPEKKQGPETAIVDEHPDTNTAGNTAGLGKINTNHGNERRIRRRAERQERQEEKRSLRQDKTRRKQEATETKKTEKEMEALKEKLTPKWLPQDEQKENTNAQTVEGRTILSSYKKANHHDLDIASQLTADEAKIKELLDETTVQEKKFQDMVNAKYGAKDEVLSVKLDEKEPFTVMEIPLDTALTTADLVKLVNYFTGLKNKWLYGCRGYSLVQTDEDGAQYPKRSYLRCLVPHIVVKTKKSNPEYRYLRVPYPAILDGMKAINNQCGVLVGTRNTKHLGFRFLNLFKIKGKSTEVSDSYTAGKAKQFPIELQVGGGIRGRILDKITKLPILAVHARIQSVFGPLNANTDAGGVYVFQTVPHRGLRMEVFGHHRKYQDGSGPITELKVAEIADQPDFYLDPKRVTVRGKVTQTFKPKFGSGLKGIRVAFTGFEKEFFTDTIDEEGHYEIKNVPSSLVKMFSHDQTRGHEEGAKTVDLDPDHDNNDVNINMEPRLTILHGKVMIPKGRGVKGLTVQITGHPELTTLTDDKGFYEFKDIPIQLSGIQVFPDKENIYGGNTQDLSTLVPYETNNKDIIVPYSRSDISGRVINIVDKTPISGASVWVEGGKERYHATTDSNGHYEIIEVPDTARVLRVETQGNKYIDRPRNIDPLPQPGKDIPNQNFNLVPREYTINRIVFIVTWNDKQADNDSQLFFPNDMHLYYKTLGDNSIGQTGGANLDRDDTGTNGRETTIVDITGGHTKLTGPYPFLIYQYQDWHHTFQETETLVEVYRDGQYVRDIKPNPGSGRLWYVCDVIGKDIRDINQFPTDIQSEIAAINDSILKKEKELSDIKASLVTDSKAIEDMIVAQKADAEAQKQFESDLAGLQAPAAPATPPPSPATIKARKKELSQKIKALKAKHAKASTDIKKAQDALKKKTDDSAHAEETMKKFKEDSFNKIKELEKSMAMSLRNYR